MLDNVVGIILFIFSFALLICIHEAGHLSMAKLFKVYCKEYSIGFGPAIFSKKKEGHETKFSLRWIPLGGYVAMYGEDTENDEDFKDVPYERSLEGIKKWKKAIVISAGVILNAILAFVLVFISNFACPIINYTNKAVVTPESALAVKGVESGDHLTYVLPEENYKANGGVPFSYEYSDSNKELHSNVFFIVDPNVVVNDGFTTEHYIMTYMYTGNKKQPNFTDGIILYEAIERSQVDNKEQTSKLFSTWSKETGSPDYYPDIERGAHTFKEDVKFEATLLFRKGETNEISGKTIEFSLKSKKKGKGYTNSFEDIGLKFETRNATKDFSGKEKWKFTLQDYGDASVAVFKGLKILFTGGIKNMSGVIGIADASASLYANYTFSTYLYFWALISVNLAIFNLLPFPGLDGWQLLVTAIEGISKKKLPAKFKTIMSLVGLGILFALMAVILFIDVFRIIGV